MLYLLAIIVMVWSLIVQFRLKSLVKKYDKEEAACGMTADEVARQMLDAYDVTGIIITHKSGDLTDCYSPNEGKIYLSDTTYGKSSITAIAVAAHECGHAVQDSSGMFLYRCRQALAPFAGICSRAGVWIAIIGVILMSAIDNMSSFGGTASNIGYALCNLGIVVYLVSFLFYLFMLPVERDASRRALKAMNKYGWVSSSQYKGAKKVLRAAGDTYAVALASSAITLLRLLAMRGNRRR